MLRIKDTKKSFFTSKEHYEQFRAAWSKAANQEKEADRPGPEAYILYALIRGYPENWGFTPITNPKKLESGRKADEAFLNARYFLQYKIAIAIPPHNQKYGLDDYMKLFGGTITEAQLVVIGELLKNNPFNQELKEVYLPGFEKDNNSGI